MLGVAPGPAAALHPLVGWQGQGRAREDIAHLRPPSSLQRRWIDADTRRRDRPLDLVGEKELARIAPQIVHRQLGAAVALLRAVPELHDPVRAVADVVGGLLQRLGRNPREIGNGASPQRVPLMPGKDAEQQLPNGRDGKVTFRQLDEKRVAVVHRLAQIGEGVRIAAGSLGLTGELQQQRGLADEVEGDVGERDVFLQDRCVPAPFGQAMAEHEPIVGEAKEILDDVGGARSRCGGLCGHGRAQTFTPRGTL